MGGYELVGKASHPGGFRCRGLELDGDGGTTALSQDVQECFPAVRDPEYIEELHNIINKVLERYDTFAKVSFASAPAAAPVFTPEGLPLTGATCCVPQEEFMDVCRSLGVMEGLQRLDQLCAQQGIHGTDSNVAPWCACALPSNPLLTAAASHRDRTQPYANLRSPFSAHFAALTRRVRGGRVKLRVPPAGGLAPEAAARKQRMALKLAERQRLVDLVGQVSDSNLTRFLPTGGLHWVSLVSPSSRNHHPRQAEQEHAEVSHNTTELRAKVAERASQLEKAAAALGHVRVARSPSRRREPHMRFTLLIDILKARSYCVGTSAKSHPLGIVRWTAPGCQRVIVTHMCAELCTSATSQVHKANAIWANPSAAQVSAQ